MAALKEQAAREGGLEQVLPTISEGVPDGHQGALPAPASASEPGEAAGEGSVPLGCQWLSVIAPQVLIICCGS